MTAPYKDWTVQPHGPLDPIGEDMLTVVGTIHMPLGEFPRRMTIVRLGDGRLIVYSAIALDEERMAKIEAFGRPAFLIVPSERHRLDAPAYKARYPDLTVLAPSGARAKVQEVVPVDAETADFGDEVTWVEVPGTNGTEAALEVKGRDGLTLVVNEIVGAIHHAGGLRGWLHARRFERRRRRRADARIRRRRGQRHQARDWARVDGDRRARCQCKLSNVNGHGHHAGFNG